ncbi:hypothetical protein [uncultured Luteimonas sp.]|uniref:hypothetical protein n=1 Tax=uncultured Luteimonas sp. TaxID=453144 RepID=UPI002634F212|nr:hypothetical protein [uncultured Luteimonas sp.]
MKSTHLPHVRLPLLAAALTLALAGCGDGAAPQATGPDAGSSAAPTAPEAAPAAAIPRFADGHDACFRAVAEQLGADTEVSEITSTFSADSGELQVCTVDYRNPADPRKLVGQRLDPATGRFSEPYDIELSVSGNAADFRLDDYLMPLSQVDAAALSGVMEAQKPALDGVYSSYSWTGVRLVPPGAFSDEHTLRLDLEGRLAANDIKNGGYLSVSVDGGTIAANHLLP